MTAFPRDAASDRTSAALDADLREQLDTLVDFARSIDDEALEEPSALPGWTVRDLLAHVALSLGVLEQAEALDGEAHLDHSLASYLASYADNAAGIAAAAREEIEAVASALESAGQRALDHLAALRAADTRIVRVRRGVVALDMLVMTRLIELVVHGDDLARSTSLPSPVDPTARTLVAQALLEILTRRTGYDLEIGDEKRWVRLAAGRIGWGERADALRPSNLAEGLPDLGGSLPLVG